MNHELDDDLEARRLLGPLAGDPPGPSRLDVPGAMAEGRRRRRTRWWATGTAVVALTATSVAGGTFAVAAIDRPAPDPLQPAPEMLETAAAAGGPSGPAGCRVTRLPTDGADQAVVTGGDPSGRLLSGRLYRDTDRNFDRLQVIWRDGRIAERFRLPGGDGAIYDLNTDGIGVGSAFTDDEEMPYAYARGRVIALAGGSGQAAAINDDGVVVGRSGAVAAQWRTLDARPITLPVPSGAAESAAVDIDRDGTVLGAVGHGRETTAYLWTADGTGDYLPLPAVDGKPSSFFWAESIAGGWVTGRAGIEDEDGGTRFAYFRYRVATREYERLPDRVGTPAGIAPNGWVLGDGDGTGATIAAGDRLTALPGYGPEKGVQLAALSADGLVAGGHTVPMAEGAENEPLMWRCRAAG